MITNIKLKTRGIPFYKTPNSLKTLTLEGVYHNIPVIIKIKRKENESFSGKGRIISITPKNKKIHTQWQTLYTFSPKISIDKKTISEVFINKALKVLNKKLNKYEWICDNKLTNAPIYYTFYAKTPVYEQNIPIYYKIEVVRNKAQLFAGFCENYHHKIIKSKMYDITYLIDNFNKVECDIKTDISNNIQKYKKIKNSLTYLQQEITPQIEIENYHHDTICFSIKENSTTNLFNINVPLSEPPSKSKLHINIVSHRNISDNTLQKILEIDEIKPFSKKIKKYEITERGHTLKTKNLTMTISKEPRHAFSLQSSATKSNHHLFTISISGKANIETIRKLITILEPSIELSKNLFLQYNI